MKQLLIDDRWPNFRKLISIVGGSALILLIPLLAMQFTDEVDWEVMDFVVAASLLILAGTIFEIARGKGRTKEYRGAIGLAAAGALLIVWVNLAVGIIGDPNNFANLAYLGILAVGLLGASISHLDPDWMSRTMFLLAILQALVTIIAVIVTISTSTAGVGAIIILNAFFILLWMGSGYLFRVAANRESETPSNFLIRNRLV